MERKYFLYLAFSMLILKVSRVHLKLVYDSVKISVEQIWVEDRGCSGW